ncbi:MAG: hypothetical protein EXS31_12065 [Pedosphaera sp.]|nr:hypothetical protein [Pedosphaera sp.]
MKPQSRLLVIGLCCCLLASGCTAFRSEWKSARNITTPAEDISGRWKGTWQSDATGHHGGLRCVVTMLDPVSYRFFYDASYKRILHGYYTITQTVTRAERTFKLQGSAELPKIFGGHYDYEGTATTTNLISNYTTKADHGVFQMIRP